MVKRSYCLFFRWFEGSIVFGKTLGVFKLLQKGVFLRNRIINSTRFGSVAHISTSQTISFLLFKQMGCKTPVLKTAMFSFDWSPSHSNIRTAARCSFTKQFLVRIWHLVLVVSHQLFTSFTMWEICPSKILLSDRLGHMAILNAWKVCGCRC